MTPTPLWRYVVTALVAVVGPPLGLFAGFIAWVGWNDCFLSCQGHPDHLGGGLLGLLAVALLLAGPALSIWLLRSWQWVVGTIALPLLVVGLPALS